MKIELIGDKSTWDAFIERSPHGTIFHRWDFLKIVEKYVRYKLYPFGIFDGNELLSVIPFYLSLRGGLKMMLSPPAINMANVPYLGFSMCPEFERLKLSERADLMGRALREVDTGLRRMATNYICIGMNPGLKDVRPFVWDAYETDQQYTYILDLTRPLKEIWDGFDRDCKKNINECMKFPLAFNESEDVGRFCEILKKNLTRDGPTFYHRQDPAYLKELLAAFPDNIKLYFFYNGDEVVGVKMNAGHKKHYISWIGNVAMQKDLNVNEFFYWEMIKKAKSEGYRTFENYGTIDKRLNNFKSKFNPTLEPCFYVVKKDGLYRTVELSYNAVSRVANVPKAIMGNKR